MPFAFTFEKTGLKALDKRIQNMKYTLLEQAQYRAMTKVKNIVAKELKSEWNGAPYKRQGKNLHRNAIVDGVFSIINRKANGIITSSIGVRRKTKYTYVANILNPGFTTSKGAKIAGLRIREKGLLIAQRESALFQKYLEASALKMLNGK